MRRLLGAFPGSNARPNNATDLPQLRAGRVSQGFGFQGERCAQVNRPVDPNNPPQDYVEKTPARSSASLTTAGASHSPESVPTRVCRAVQPELTSKSNASAISAIVADGLRYPTPLWSKCAPTTLPSDLWPGARRMSRFTHHSQVQVPHLATRTYQLTGKGTTTRVLPTDEK
jgi:hypothetical protein